MVHRRNLPHIQSPGSVYFVTFRASKSFVFSSQAKDIIYDNILHYAKLMFDVYGFVIMPDHVYLIIQPYGRDERKYYSLPAIMQAVKGYSSKQIKRNMVERTPPSVHNIQRNKKFTSDSTEKKPIYIPKKIFQSEYFDRIIRNENEFKQKMQYIINNPVKHGLVENPFHYKWLYLHDQ